MKKLLLLFISITLLNPNWVFGQICGTPTPTNPVIYSGNANARGASSAYCIDVYFHIVRNTNGSNAFTLPNTDDITEELNEYFSPHNIVINNAGFDFINNSNFLTLDALYGTEDDALFSTENQAGVINFYIVDNFVTTGVVGLAEDSPSRNLVMRDEDAISFVSAHELGHCLNLYHTFEGSGTNDETCPEAINGSNCETCGDLVCDTPADANTRNTGGYSPDLTNIMSYYQPADHFTDGQGVRMRTALSKESILQDITSSSCVSISEVNNICPPEETNISLSNLGGATTNWSASNNVQIVSSNNSNATFTSISGSVQEDGWIRATLNNGIELTEEFWIGNVKFDDGEITGPSTLYVGSNGYYQAPEAQGKNYYQWNFPDGGFNIIAGQGNTTARIEAKSTGMKVIELRAYNNCGYRYKYIYVNVKSSSSGGGGGSNPCPNTLAISPNPTTNGDIEALVIQPPGDGGGDEPCLPTISSSSNMVELNSNSESFQDGVVIITDQFGEVVYEKKHKGKKVKLKLHKLNQGIYTIHYMFNNEELLSTKFIKQ